MDITQTTFAFAESRKATQKICTPTVQYSRNDKIIQKAQ